MCKVLKPFQDHTNTVSKACPTITKSLLVYQNLDNVLDNIKKAEGDFEGVTKEIQDTVRAGIQKLNKFMKKMDGNILYYVAVILNLYIKTSFIKV